MHQVVVGMKHEQDLNGKSEVRDAGAGPDTTSLPQRPPKRDRELSFTFHISDSLTNLQYTARYRPLIIGP